MKKILVLLGILLLVGGGVGYTMYKDSNKVSSDRYGEFTTIQGKTSDLEIYVNSYSQFSDLLITLDLIYALMKMSEDQVQQFNLASEYVEKYINIQKEIYSYNANVPIPNEFEVLHESLVEEIAYTDLITDEFGDAIKNNDFSKVDEFLEKKNQAREKGLASTDMIEYRKSEGKFHLND